MPIVNGQFVVPGVFSSVNQNVLPTAPGGVRIPALIGTGRTTNLVQNYQVTRGGTATDSISPNPPTVIDGNIQDENFVIYTQNVDFILDSGVGVTWQTLAAHLTGTTLGTSYTNSLLGETFIFSVALPTPTLWTKTFVVADFQDANDTTAVVPFAITAVTDGTHLTVSSTAGMSDGDTILQGVATTTIAAVGGIVDGTHLKVVNTTGFVSSYTLANVIAALNAFIVTNSIHAVSSNDTGHLKIATTDVVNSSLYIGNGTANADLGFTAGSYVQTPDQPALHVKYFVSYEYPKVTADYTPKFYFTLQAVTNDYGPVNLGTSISNGASLAFQNGASIVCVCQENPADGSPVSQVQSALNKLLATPNIWIVVSLEGGSNPQLLSAIKQHVDTASSTINKLERRAIVGFDETVTTFSDQDMLSYALAADDNRVVLLNSAENVNTEFVGTATVATQVGSQYAAAALAGVRCNPAFDVAQPMTREVISGFSSITNTLTQAEKSILINQGVCVIDVVSGVPKVLFGTTTDFATVAAQLEQVTEIADFTVQSLRGLLDPIFIGQKLLANTLSQVQTVVSAILQSIQQSNIIVAFTTPVVTVDISDPTRIDISVGIQPVLEVDVIFITLGLNLQ